MSGMTLTEFLLARIAEDDEAARALLAEGWTHDGSPSPTADQPMARFGRVAFTLGRVLADCEAKRRIVALHGDAHECSTYDHTGEIDNCTWCLYATDCSTMRLLAAVYGDHPDYRDEWRP
jgi:hypothetical protein